MDHPKKIAFTCNSSWGIYKFRLSLIRQMVHQGYSVYILAPEDRYTSYLLDEPGTIYIPLRRFRPISFSIYGDWQLYRELLGHYKRIRPWLIFHYTIKANIFGTLAASRAHAPSISVITGLGYTFLNNSWLKTAAKTLYRFALRRAREVWFLNADDRDYFIGQHLVPFAKTFVLPGEGIDTTVFDCRTPHRLAPSIRFLLIGRIIKEKGIEEYVYAARILKQKGYTVECQLAGFYDYKNPSSIPHKTFFGWVESGLITYLGSTDDVKPLIEKANCVVLPSYREGLPLSLLEGACMCRPLITTDTAGCRDVVLNGQTGFLCHERDAQSLALAMEAFCLLSPGERISMGQAARKYAVEHFSQEKIHGCYFKRMAALKGTLQQPEAITQKIAG